MALTLEFIGAKPGDTCELYHGEPYTNRELRGNIDPLHTTRLTDKLMAALSSTQGSGYAVRLKNSGGHVYARSNTRPLNSKTKLFVLPITVRILERDSPTLMPPLPFKDERTTFDRLVLDFIGADFRLFGHALHDGVINKKFTFDYRFRVNPVDVPVWHPVSENDEDEVPEDTFDFKTSSLTIDTDKDRQELLMGILNPIIRRKFRRGLQRKFHDAALKKVEGNVLKPVLTLTSAPVSADFADLNFTVLGEPLG